MLPASPDGRDLAPRIAYVLDRPLVAGAVSIAPDRITVPRRGGLELHVLAVAPPIVATLQPGVRGVEPARVDRPRITRASCSNDARLPIRRSSPSIRPT